MFDQLARDMIVAEQKYFSERKWVFEQINNWLDKPEPDQRRYFLLTGEPGSGKSAIARRLKVFSDGNVQPGAGLTRLARGCLIASHFCMARSPLSVDGSEFAQAISAQLALRLEGFLQAVIEAGDNSQRNFDVKVIFEEIKQGGEVTIFKDLNLSGLTAQKSFNQLVLKPLQRLFPKETGHPVIILVDALDEALARGGDSIVDLLADLEGTPSNVRFLLTSRPDKHVLSRFPSRPKLSLSDSQFTQNYEKDLADYVKKRIALDKDLKNRLTGKALKKCRNWTKTVVARTDGNFQYAYFLLNEIAKGMRSPVELEGLPSGLDLLYHQSLERLIRLGQKDWSCEYQPLLGVLSVAGQALDLDQLKQFSGQDETDLWNNLGDLSQFTERLVLPDSSIDEDDEGLDFYHLYHQSFIDFLRKKVVGPKKDRQDNNYFTPAEKWHWQIVNHYRDQASTPAEVDWNRVDDYGLKYYGYHLESAGAKVDELAALVSDSWLQLWQESKSTEWGFLQELERIYRIVKQSNEANVVQLGQVPYLHHEAKSLLAKASLVSLNCGTPPELLRALLDKNVWDTDRALVDARLGPVPLNRAIALAVIAPQLIIEKARDLLDEAAAIARELEPEERSEVFKAMCLAWLDIGDIQQAEQAQREVEDQHWRTEMLVANVELFAKTLDIKTLLGTTKGLEAQNTFYVLLSMMSQVDGEVRQILYGRAKSSAESKFRFEEEQAIALLRLARAEPEQQTDLVEHALNIAEDVAQWKMSEEPCSKIFAELPPSLTQEQLTRSFSIAERVEHHSPVNTLVLAELVRFQPDERRHHARREILQEILNEGWLLDKEEDLFASWVADLYDDETVSLFESFRKEGLFRHSGVSLNLANRVSDDVFESVVREILIAALSLSKGYISDDEWGEIAQHMPQKRYLKVLEAMNDIADDDELQLTQLRRTISTHGSKREPMRGEERRNRLGGFLKAAASDLPIESLEAAVAFARSMGEPSERCATLTKLLPRLTGNLQQCATRDALAAAHLFGFAGYWDVRFRQELFANLPKGLSVELQQAAVELVARQCCGDRAPAIASLAPKLEPQPLKDLRRLAREIGDSYTIYKCVQALVPFATPRTASQWIEILIKEDSYWGKAESLIAYTSPEFFPGLLQLNENFRNPDMSAKYIAAFAPRLDGELLHEAIRRLEGLDFKGRRLKERHYISPLVLRLIQLDFTSEALDVIERWPYAQGKAHALSTICRQLPSETFERAERIARSIDSNYYTCKALCALAPLTPAPGALRAEVLQKAGKSSLIYMLVLATDWKEEFQKESLWKHATMDLSPTMGLSWFTPRKLEYLDSALNHCSPQQCEWAVSLLLQQFSPLPDKDSQLYTELLPILTYHCVGDQFMQIATLATYIHNVYSWVEVVDPLLEHAPPNQRRTLSDKARYYSSSGRHVIITDVIAARFGTKVKRREVIEESLQTMGQDNAGLLRYVAPLLILQPTEECYHYCSEFMLSFAQEGREGLLEAMTSLAPAIGHLQSRDNVSKILDAIQEVRDWWP